MKKPIKMWTDIKQYSEKCIHSLLLMFCLPLSLLGQTITTTTIPNVLFEDVGGSSFTYCITIYGTGGDDWELGTDFATAFLIADGLSIAGESATSLELEYTPGGTVPSGSFQVIYRDTGGGTSDNDTYNVTINGGGATPATIQADIGGAPATSIDLGDFSPGATISATSVLFSGGTGMITPTFNSGAPGFTLTHDQVDIRRYELNGSVPATPGSHNVVFDVDDCASTGGTITFTFDVITPTTDVEIAITGTDGNPATANVFDLPIAMVNKDYPLATASLPSIRAAGGSAGGAGGNVHDWSHTGMPTFLGFSVSPLTDIAEGTNIDFTSPSRPTTDGTVNFSITAADDTDATNNDRVDFELEVLEELILTPDDDEFEGSLSFSGSALEATITANLAGNVGDWSIVEAVDDGAGNFDPYTETWLELDNATTTTVELQRTGSPTSGGTFEFRIQFSHQGYISVSDVMTYVIERPPIDIIFALDRSGSMGWKAVDDIGNDRSRWFYLEQAMTQLFAWLGDDGSGSDDFALTDDDRVGLLLYNSEVTEELSSPLVTYVASIDGDISSALTSVTISDTGTEPGRTGATPDEAIDKRGTGMGGALLSAISRLCEDCPTNSGHKICGDVDETCDGRTKIVILFTDGLQNENPMITASGTTANIEDLPAEPHVTTLPAAVTTISGEIGVPVGLHTTEFARASTNPRSNYYVFTIGLSDNVHSDVADVLSNLAARTKASYFGVYSNLDGTSNDFNGFSEAFTNAMINALEGGSPQIVDSRPRRLPGTEGEESFEINANVNRVIFALYGQREDRLDLQVFKDNQQVINMGEIISSGATYKIFSISTAPGRTGERAIDPQGTWTVRVSGKANAGFELMAMVDDHLTEYDCYMRENSWLAGSTMGIITDLHYGGTKLNNFKVTAEICRPGQDFPTLVSKATTPRSIRPWLQSNYTWNTELFNRLDVKPPSNVKTEEPFPMSGIVLGENGKPVGNATVSVKGTKQSVRTDENGRYTLSNVKLNDVVRVTGKDGVNIKEILITGAILVGGQAVLDLALGNTPDKVDPILANIIKTEPGISPAEAKIEYMRLEGLLAPYFNLGKRAIPLLLQHAGHYEADYSGEEITGAHQVYYRIEGEIPGVGKIHRLATNTAIVRFGPISLENSELYTIIDRVVDGVTYASIIVEPVDQFGHSIGLGRALDIDVQVNPNLIIKGQWIDRLDGSYVLPVEVRGNGMESQVKLIVDGQSTPLYSGAFEQIPDKTETEGKKKRIPIGTGIAFPTGNFADAYDPGLMLELKFGIPLTQNKKLNLNLEGGYYTFDQKPQVNELQIAGGAAGLRYDFISTPNGWRAFADGNLGYYVPTDIDGALGVNVGAGISKTLISPAFSLGLGVGYFHIFTDDEIDFYTLGLEVSFNLNP